MSGWAWLKESKESRGLLEELQDTRIDLKITGNPKGLDAKQPRASSSSGHRREEWRPVRPNRRRSGGLGARARFGTERGDR
jgi:hypothetical protein